MYGVKDLSQALKATIEELFGEVQVVGEVSSCQKAASGHLYLTLKEEKYVLEAVCWRYTKTTNPITMGQTMAFHGNLTSYPDRSKYQLVIKEAWFTAPGKLLQEIEALKQKLLQEGLFANARPLPIMPKRVGIITSESGAVLHDMELQFARCLPTDLILCPASVQGEKAVSEILAALDKLLTAEVEVVIIARGGGSAEDLASFNSEDLVRKIASYPLPLVSGVGHETDVTLCDHAADLRASTPTAAALAVLPLREDLLDRAGLLADQCWTRVQRLLEQAGPRAEIQVSGICDIHRQSLDYLQQSVDQRMREIFERSLPPLPNLVMDRQSMEAPHDVLGKIGADLERCRQVIEATSIDKTLRRGFCLAKRGERYLKSAKDVGTGKPLKLRFHDGEVDLLSMNRV